MQTAAEDGRQTLTFYADRPSARYVPPFYFEVVFPKVGPKRTSTGFHGAGGACK